MIRNEIFAVGLVTGYLFLYCLLIQFEATLGYAALMLLFSPLLVGWMVYYVLKYGKYEGEPLGDDEFGYQDKQKDELKVF